MSLCSLFSLKLICSNRKTITNALQLPLFVFVVVFLCFGFPPPIFSRFCFLGEACTIVLRGATQQILDEAERSLHDALCVLAQTVKDTRTVYGGGEYCILCM